jgi:hypothetical protein
MLVGLAIVVIAIGAITVISRQGGASAKSATPTHASQTVQNQKYLTVKVAGQEVQVNPQTGQVRQMTPEQAQRLADSLKTMLNKSSEGLVQEQHPDGSVSMDLQGRFQNVVVARVEADGTVTQSCIDKPKQAASFFGIDPALLGVEAQERTTVQQAARRSPARKSRQ